MTEPRGSVASNPARLSDLLGLLRPGQTVHLRGGTYAPVVIPDDGTAEDPIVLRSYPGELATFDGPVTVTGDHLHLVDVVVTNSDTDRASDRVGGIELRGTGAKAINCVVHDVGVALESYASNGAGAEFYGCITYNQGWELGTADRGHGHSLYIQNGTGIAKKVRHNIFGPGYGWNIHCYSASQPMEDIDWEANIAGFGGLLANENNSYSILRYGSIIGGGGAVNRHRIDRHYRAEGIWDIDYLTSGQDDLTLTGVVRGVTGKSAWTNLTDTSTSPTGDAVYVEPNEHEDGRANIIIYNATAMASAVSVDLSSVLDNGDTYGIFDGFNPLAGPLHTGTYSGPVSITMPTSFPTPVGGWRWGSAPARSVAFGAFVVRKVTSWVAPA